MVYNKSIVVFSGNHNYGGKKVTEVSLNCLNSNKVIESIYRFFITAKKFISGYSSKLLTNTMYIYKQLVGIKTLSHLNRVYIKKYNIFILVLFNHVTTDSTYQNAIKNFNKQNTRIKYDKTFRWVILKLLADHTEIFMQFSDNMLFQKWLSDIIFNTIYHSANQIETETKQ